MLDGFVIINRVKITFIKKKILGGRLTMMMPETFEPRHRYEVEKRYLTKEHPEMAYSQYGDRSHSLLLCDTRLPCVNENILVLTPLVDDKLPLDFIKVNSQDASLTEMKIIESFDRNVAYFDFICSLYNLIFFFSLDDKLVCGKLSCYKFGNLERRKPVLMQMLGSISDVE